MRAVTIAIVLSAMSACQRSPVPSPGSDRPPSASTPSNTAPPPSPNDEPMLAGSYEATSRTAMSITGDVRLTGDTVTFSLGSTYRTRLVTRVSASEEYAAGAGPWADLLNVAPHQRVELRAVVEERVNAKALNGGLCRPAAVTYLALVASPDSSGAPALMLSAFRDAAPPGPKGTADSLCGTFMFGSAGRLSQTAEQSSLKAES